MTVIERFRSVVPKGGKLPLVAAVAVGIATSALTGEPPGRPSAAADGAVGVQDGSGTLRVGPAGKSAAAAEEIGAAAESSVAAGRARELFGSDAQAVAGVMRGRLGSSGQVSESARGSSLPTRGESMPAARPLAGGERSAGRQTGKPRRLGGGDHRIYPRRCVRNSENYAGSHRKILDGCVSY